MNDKVPCHGATVRCAQLSRLKAAPMAKRVLLTFVAVAALWSFRLCLLYATGYALGIPFPTWWLYLVPKAAHGILLWSFLCHTVAAIAVALPFAWLFARLYGKLGVYLGAMATLIIVVPDSLSIARSFGSLSTFLQVVVVIDMIKFLVALPILAWWFHWLPSNRSLGRSR